MEYYWSITPDEPTEMARRFTVHALAAVERGRYLLDSHSVVKTKLQESDARVLDLGTRTGGLLTAVAERGRSAIGIDIAKYLPGLYWLNFFGAPYGNLIGEKRLASTAAYHVASCGSGYLLQLGPDPEDWNSRAYRDCEESVRRYLGEVYFFNRDREQGNSVSPFDLPKLSPGGKIEADVELQSGNPVVTQIRLKGLPD